MAECIKCKKYTKFENGLCTDCYYEKNSEGLSNKEKNFRYNNIKGRIAETFKCKFHLSNIQQSVGFTPSNSS